MVISVIHLTNAIIKLHLNVSYTGHSRRGKNKFGYRNCISVIRNVTPSNLNPHHHHSIPTQHAHVSLPCHPLLAASYVSVPRAYICSIRRHPSLVDANDDDIHLIIDNKLTGWFVRRFIQDYLSVCLLVSFFCVSFGIPLIPLTSCSILTFAPKQFYRLLSPTHPFVILTCPMFSNPYL